MASKDEVLAALEPVLALLSTLDPSEAGAAARLEAAFPVKGPAMAALRALVREGVAARWLCEKENGGVRFGRLAKAAQGFSVDVVHLGGPGAAHTHPAGEFDLCFAVTGRGAPAYSRTGSEAPIIGGIMEKMKSFIRSRVRFDRNEVSGAFGDIGTDLPLIIGMIACSGINGAWVFVVFGVMQIATAFIYGIPMPVQPLKAVALIVITQKIGGDVLFGGGLAIGVVMLLLSITGVIEWLGKVIPLAVVRGIQMGLGLQLAILALKEYIPSDSTPGFLVAGMAFVVTIALIGNRRFPPALPIIVMGALYGFLIKYDPSLFRGPQSLGLPSLHVPSIDSIMTGFLVLALPQIPLSLGNSIYASSRIITDYFPEKQVPVQKIGFTYSLMNIVSPFVGGIPVCHGSGGLAGHYAFGARTGGSIMIYGLIFVVAGLSLGGNVNGMALLFPKPVLGVILLFEGVSLLKLVMDMAHAKNEFVITLLVSLAAVCLPYGYLVGMATGTALFYLYDRRIIGVADPVRLGSAEAPNQ